MTLAIYKMDEHGFSDTASCECPAEKTKVMWYQLQGTPDSSNKTEHFSYKGEWANA